MQIFTTLESPSENHSVGMEVLFEWRNILTPAIEALRHMAGTTEDEFLQIGSEVQDFYHRSVEISQMSNKLVEIVSGESCQSLTARLQQMMAEIATRATKL